MSFSNPNESGEEQNTSNQRRDDYETAAPPRAASERDVKEAEQKAEQAQRHAVEETEKVRAELREEIEELREENRQLRQVARVLDYEVNTLIHNAKHRTLGKSFNRDKGAFEAVEDGDVRDPDEISDGEVVVD